MGAGTGIAVAECLGVCLGEWVAESKTECVADSLATVRPNVTTEGVSKGEGDPREFGLPRE